MTGTTDSTEATVPAGGTYYLKISEAILVVDIY